MREIVFKAKVKDWEQKPKDEQWVYGYYVRGFNMYEEPIHMIFDTTTMFYSHGETDGWDEIDQSTLCQYTGLTDKNGNKIWENDVVRGHGNPKDLAKVVFGEFCVIEVESLEKVDSVVGWHTEVIPTDALSKCEPFCLPMPLTDFYIKHCEWEVIGSIFDNPELLKAGEA